MMLNILTFFILLICGCFILLLVIIFTIKLLLVYGCNASLVFLLFYLISIFLEQQIIIGRFMIMSIMQKLFLN